MNNIEYGFILVKPAGSKDESFKFVLREIFEMDLYLSKFLIGRLPESKFNKRYYNIKKESFYYDFKEYMLSDNILAILAKGNNVNLKLKDIAKKYNKRFRDSENFPKKYFNLVHVSEDKFELIDDINIYFDTDIKIDIFEHYNNKEKIKTKTKSFAIK